MNTITLLLADSVCNNRLKSLRNAFNEPESGSSDMTKLYFFGVLVAVLLIALFVARRAAQKENRGAAATKPLRLFGRVLKELGTPFADRCIMRMAAQQSGLRQPTVMLFSPDLFERHAGRWADGVAVRVLRPLARSRVDAVAARAFPGTVPSHLHVGDVDDPDLP